VHLVPGLTSAALAWDLAVLAAALLGILLLGWPRLAGSGLPQVARRLIALCLVQASLLVLVLVLVNQAGGFYSSWSDLLGRYTGGGTLRSLTEIAPDNTARLTVLGSVPVSIPGNVHPVGSLQAVAIAGQLSGLSFGGHVYLPPGYPHALGGHVRYPVIVAISASLAATKAGGGAMRLAVAAAEQIASGRLRPLIVVMLPAGPGTDLGCLNVPGGPQAALFFSSDLPASIASRYLAGSGRNKWGLLGDASGGYCALQLALTNAPVFSAAAVPARPYIAPPGPPAGGRGSPFGLQDNLAWLVRHQPMQPISVLFTGAGQARPFVSIARSPMLVTAQSPASSSLSVLALDWLGRLLNVPGGR
jgi:hypothetical protein